MASHIRRFVWFVIIGGCLCGRLAAQTHYVPDKVGKWTLNPQPSLRKMFGLSAAEKSRFQTKTAALTSLIRECKTFNPPMGFDPVVFAQFLAADECWVWEDKPCPAHPAVFRLEVYIYEYLDFGTGRIYRDKEAETEAMITVNDLTHALGAYPFGSNVHRMLPDGRTILYMPREIPLRVSGFQVYEKPLGRSKHFFLTRRDRLPWVPVTRKQFLVSLMDETEYRFASEAKRESPCDFRYREWISEQETRRRNNEKWYQEKKKTSPADAEKLRAELEKREAEQRADLLSAQARCEEDRKQIPAKVAKENERFRAELARLTPAERASQAWYNPRMDRYNASGLVAPTAPRAGGLVAINPDFFDRSRPRTDFQIICVEVTSKPDFELKKDDIPYYTLHEFLTTTMDWQRVAALLD